MTYRLFLLAIMILTLVPGRIPAQAQPGAPFSQPTLTSLIAPSQAGGDEKLTLDQAVDLALRNHPLIRATVFAREIVDAQLREAQAGYWPQLQFSEIFTHSNNPVFVFGSLLEQSRFGPQNFSIDSLNSPSPLSNFRTALIVRMPIFDQLETQTRVSQAKIGQEQAERQQDQVRQQVRLEVIRSFYGVLVSEGKRDAASEAVKMAEAEVGRIRNFYETGMVVQADLLAAQVQLAEFRQQEVEATGEAVTMHAALNTVLDLPGGESRKVAGRLTEKSFSLPGVEDLVQSALSYRPDYARADLTVRSQEKRARGAWGQYLPKVDVFSTYGMSSRDLTSGSSDYAIGAGLTYNIFDQSRGARLDQARAAQAMASAEKEHLSNQIRLEIVGAYQKYVSARERLNLASDAVEQAKEALRIVQNRYEEGLTTITEVLRAQTAFVRARQNLLSARYDYYLGYARVLIASGRLTDVQPFVS